MICSATSAVILDAYRNDLIEIDPFSGTEEKIEICHEQESSPDLLHEELLLLLQGLTS
jgi:hypothetical protein